MADQDVTIRIKVDTALGVVSLKALGSETEAVGGRVRDAQGRFVAAGKTIGDSVAAGSARGTSAIEELEKALGSASSQVGGLGRVAEMALGVSLGQIGAQAADRFRQGISDAVGVGMTFEQQLADLSAITGIAGADLDALGAGAREAAVETGVGASEQAEAFKLLASNIDVATMGGIGGLQAMGREVVTLSVAAGTDLAMAADAVAGAINMWGLEADQAARVVNVLAAGAKAGAAEVPDLAAAMGAAGVTAAAAGVSIEATTGAIEILAQNTVKGAEAGTGLRNVLTIMQTETDKLAKYGVTGLNIKTEGLTETLRKLGPILNNTTALADVFGRENLNVAQILIGGADAVNEMTAAVTGTQTAQEQADIQMSTLKGSVQLLKTALEELALNGYDGLGGAARDLVMGVRDTVVWLDKNWDSVETGIKILALAGIAYSTFQAATLLAKVETQAMILTDGIAAASKVTLAGVTGAATAAMEAFNLAVRSNPLGLLLGVLATAAGAWVMFRSDTDEATASLARNETQAKQTQAAIANLSLEAAQARLEINKTRREAMLAGFLGGGPALTTADLTNRNRPGTPYRSVLGDPAGPGAVQGLNDFRNGGDRTTAVDGTNTALRRESVALQGALTASTAEEAALKEHIAGLAANAASTAASAAAGSSTTAADPAKKPKESTEGETPAQRTARLKREREQQARDDERATEDSLHLTQQAADDRETIRIAEAVQTEAIRQQDAHANARASAERIALIEDEIERRRAVVADADARRTQEYEAQLVEIERVAQAERSAIDTTYNREEDRIKEARKEKDLSAAETKRLDDRLAAAAAARDRATTDTDNRRELATRQALEARRDGEAEAAAARREIDADEAARDHTRFTEHGEQVNREMARARAAIAEEDRLREEAHERQMQRIQEAARAVQEAVGVAVALYSAVQGAREEGLRRELSRAADLRDAAARRDDERYDDEEKRQRDAEDAEVDRLRSRGAAQAQIAAAQKRLEAARAAREDARARTVEAREKAERKATFEGEKALAEYQRSAAKAQRAAAVFQIALQTAINVAKSFPNPFAMGAAAALGVAQGATVLAQPLPQVPDPPAYALGTDYHPGGLAIVGERGPEIVNLPGGSSVITNDRSERIGRAIEQLDRSRGAGALGAGGSVVVQTERYDDSRLVSAMDRVERAVHARLEAVERAVYATEASIGDEQIFRASDRGRQTVQRETVPFSDI